MKRNIITILTILSVLAMGDEKTRVQLKSYFETGDNPTEEEFGHLIDSQYNIQDDLILSIELFNTFAKLDAIVADKSLTNTQDSFNWTLAQLFQGGVKVGSIDEYALDSGVTIDGLTVKDGGVTGTTATFDDVIIGNELTLTQNVTVAAHLEADSFFSNSAVLDALTMGGAITMGAEDINGTGTASMGTFTAANGFSTAAGTLTIGGLSTFVGTVDFSQWMDLNPIVGPAHSEGRVFYDTNSHALTVYNDKSDVALQVGEEMWVRVINQTGSQIDDGEVVYVSGAASGVPSVTLANAATPSTASKTLGVATGDIANGATGYITTHGSVRGIDLSSFSIGDELWLSSTTAGAVVNSPPAAPATTVRIGTVLDDDPTEGSMFVRVDAAVESEHIYGIMSVQSGVTSEATTDATPRQVTAWNTDGISDGITVDHTDDAVQVGVDGVYEVNCAVSFSTSSGADLYHVEIYWYDDTTTTWTPSGFAFDRKTGTGGDVGSTSCNALLALDTNDKVSIFHSTSTGGTNFLVTSAQMTIKRLAD